MKLDDDVDHFGFTSANCSIRAILPLARTGLVDGQMPHRARGHCTLAQRSAVVIVDNNFTRVKHTSRVEQRFQTAHKCYNRRRFGPVEPSSLGLA